VTINEAIKKLVGTKVEFRPRKMRREIYSGPITLPRDQQFQHVRESLKKGGSALRLPTGNESFWLLTRDADPC
jgi:hypothetical protein